MKIILKILNSQLFWFLLWLAGIVYIGISAAIEESGQRRYPSQLYINIPEHFILSVILILAPIIASLRSYYKYMEVRKKEFLIFAICNCLIGISMALTELNIYFDLIAYIQKR